jgi:hypothetical protein
LYTTFFKISHRGLPEENGNFENAKMKKEKMLPEKRRGGILIKSIGMRSHLHAARCAGGDKST